MRNAPGIVFWVNRKAAIGNVARIAEAGADSRKRKVADRTGQRGRAAAKKTALADILRETGRRMGPFYRKAAGSESFARRFSEAVTELDLDRIERMIKEASPRIGENFPGTNGIGYFVGLPFAKPIGVYSSGTTIPPGTVQFTFEPEAFQKVSQAVCPLYSRLALNLRYARQLAHAIGEKDPEAAAKLVRAVVKDPALKSVAVESQGIALRFRFSFTPYTYRHLLMREEHP